MGIESKNNGQLERRTIGLEEIGVPSGNLLQFAIENCHI